MSKGHNNYHMIESGRSQSEEAAYRRLRSEFDELEKQLNQPDDQHNIDLAEIQLIYDQLSEDLRSLASSGVAANAESLVTSIPEYPQDLVLDESSIVQLNPEQIRRRNTANAEINPQSVSLQDEQALDLRVGSMVGEHAEKLSHDAEPGGHADAPPFEDDDIRCQSFWVSVSAKEQWHVKEFFPSSIGAGVEASQKDAGVDAQIESIRATLADAGQRSVLLVHGEFATSRCFYGRRNRENVGLAWALARKGYHVFAVDTQYQVLRYNSASQSLLSRFRSRPRGKDARLLQDKFPALITACGKRFSNRLEQRVLSRVRGLTTHFVAERTRDRSDQTAYRCQDLMQSVDELQFELSDVCDRIKAPGVWIGHGFSAAILAAVWARMSGTLSSKPRFIFFGGRRQWQGGSFYARALAKILGSGFIRKLVEVVGEFPARRLQLGAANADRQFFRCFSAWIASDSWLDPEDGFDYAQAFRSSGTPATLHVMNETESGLVAAGDVRRFANELYPDSANLIGVPSGLRAAADDPSSMSVPTFTHSGILVSADAERWIFHPVIQWLDGNTSGKSLAEVASTEQYSYEEPTNVAAQPANLAELVARGSVWG